MAQRAELKSGYVVIDVPVGMGGAVHQLYVKEHTGRDALQEESSIAGSGCTLFVGNVDLCLQMSHQDIDGYLRELMGSFGSVEAVYVSALANDKAQRKRNRDAQPNEAQSDSDSDDEETAAGLQETQLITTGRSRFAHVIFKKKSELKTFLKAARLGGTLSDITSGIGRKWGLFQNLLHGSSSISTSSSDKKGSSSSVLAASIRQANPLRCESTPAELKEDVNRFMTDFEEVRFLVVFLFPYSSCFLAIAIC